MCLLLRVLSAGGSFGPGLLWVALVGGGSAAQQMGRVDTGGWEWNSRAQENVVYNENLRTEKLTDF